MHCVNIRVVVFISLLAEISLVLSSFSCNNGEPIRENLFCNGKNDCGDFSDEFYGCDREFCGRGKFRCTNFECLPASTRCNGVVDCSDGSDEMHCDKKLSVDNCTMHKGKFLCKDRSRCVDLLQVCNDFEDCTDGSDENSNCTKYDKELCDSCPHPCFRTPNGPQCFCNSSSEFHMLCKEISDCNNYNATCQQKCVKYKDTEQCSCNEYYKIEYGALCLTRLPQENIMVYSTTNQIKFLNLTSKKPVLIKNGVSATALTAVHHSVFWSENSGSIFSMSFDGEKHEKIINTDMNITSSIAVDWITSNVYFTSQNTLSVCNDDGQICLKLKHSMFDIKYVVVAPKFGLMFWAIDTKNKYVKPCILKSAMDGSDERVFVEGMLRSPTSLSVDEPFERLYWFDTTSGKIESIRFDGSDRQVILFNAETVFSFTTVEKSRYWSTDLNNTIDAWTYESKGTLLRDESSPRIRYLHAYKPFLQNCKQILNPCETCSGLCLLQPSSSRGILNGTCLCEGFTPRSNDHWCHDKPSYQKFSAIDQRPFHNIDDEFPQVTPDLPFLSKTAIFLIVLVIVINALLSSILYFGCEKWKKTRSEGSITLNGILSSYEKE